MKDEEEYIKNVDLNSLTKSADDQEKGLLDKTDNKTCFCFPHNLESRRRTYTNDLNQSEVKETYNIFTRRFQASSKDKRVPVLTITHVWDYKNSFKPKKSHREIHFVLNPKNHTPEIPFHLNLSGQSEEFLKQDGCAGCKKYFLSLSLDHFPLVCDKKKDYGQYKFSNLDKTIASLFKKIEKNGFFTKFVYMV